ncbi:hypothetical protein O6H91_22G068300 [Diphasiastrum complanatum]|uniref:Uncharacterized protein n=3 Tax=Diphasiastrum complanatum TaxID=34168 RepID=A0ACC2AGQ2_DIPCM|nr:hypothetical protein O6H91_Y541300 [Diphasiastrum complanatum]KAJ7516706.1 hypothetical protein O6H91_22G068300 [Diphasiastrum complanatum]KAJ7516708.1 hypothetical protein O6H91_22G068300 [Diphasiastrum complanatum]KAJ7516709.1 hypothetical protein O6H91_22G068300 [Diphasiastrum complanatum]
MAPQDPLAENNGYTLDSQGPDSFPLGMKIPSTVKVRRPSAADLAPQSPILAESLAKSPVDRVFWRKRSLHRLFSLGNIKSEQELDEHARTQIVEDSIYVMRMNDFGGYTVPAQGLYPFQWNWDSAIVSAGWAVFDEARAWEELEKLFSGQWEDGMVPSIVFHRPSNTYFPGPDIWGTPQKPSKSTGITQPPVAALSVRFLYEHTENPELAEQKLVSLFPKLLAWHRWWYKARDPENTGVVAILHPWESGMDNSPAWDESMKFPIDKLPRYVRCDLNHVDSCMRPTQETYDRYLTLLHRFKAANFYDPSRLYWISPFRVTDLCVNSILIRANRDLRWLALRLEKDDIVKEIDEWLNKGFEGFKQLWDEDSGLFKCKDQLTGKLANAPISAAFLPLFAGVATKEQADKLTHNLERWLGQVNYGVPSMDPEDHRFEPLRYWRGPVWIIMNWMISNGLRHYGYDELADRIKDDSISLTTKAGLREYFDPLTGDGAGGRNFSWTAAMCLAWLDRPAAIAIGHKMSGPKKHLNA